MTESKTYVGSCHCGKVRFEATSDLARVNSCNCSICSRAGYLLTFVPAENFKLLSGEGSVTDYQFNKHNIHHVFCSTCGVRSYAHGTGKGGASTYAVNVRCLEGVDLKSLDVVEFDGKSL
jgi:hypothetical protein